MSEIIITPKILNAVSIKNTEINKLAETLLQKEEDCECCEYLLSYFKTDFEAQKESYAQLVQNTSKETADLLISIAQSNLYVVKHNIEDFKQRKSFKMAYLRARKKILGF